MVILDVGFLMERHNLEDAQRALIVHAMLKVRLFWVMPAVVPVLELRWRFCRF